MEKTGSLGEGSFCLDADAGVDTLLNDATEWLQYAQGMADLIVESLQESEILDPRRVVLALGSVSTLVVMGTQCVAEAHGKIVWEKR